MAEKFINNSSLDRNAVYDTTKKSVDVVHPIADKSAGINALVNTLDRFVADASKTLEKQTVRNAQLAGSQAGLNDTFTPRQGVSLYDEAYNKAGSEIYINKKISDVSTIISKAAMTPELANNPLALQHVLEDQREQLFKDVPLELMGDMSIAYNDRMSRAVQSAQEGQMRMTISANAGQFAETENTLLGEISNAARKGDENAIAQTRTEYFASIDRQVGLSISPEDASKKKIAVQKTIQKNVVIGDFLRTPPDQRPAFAESFIKNNPLASTLGPEEVDELKKDMIQAWEVDARLADAADDEMAINNKASLDDQRLEFSLAPTMENYTKLITSPGITAEDVKQARSYMKTYSNAPDPTTTNTMDSLILEGRLEEAREMLSDPNNASLIGQKNIRKYRDQITSAASGGGFEKTDGYKEVMRRIREDYTTMNGMSSSGKAIRQQIYDKLKTDYPKYLRGEIGFDDVDPMRLYMLKRNNTNKVESDGSKLEQVKTPEGMVVIPMKWTQNPKQFLEDRKTSNMDPRLKNSKEVNDFMVEKILKQELEEKAKAKEPK